MASDFVWRVWTVYPAKQDDFSKFAKGVNAFVDGMASHSPHNYKENEYFDDIVRVCNKFRGIDISEFTDKRVNLDWFIVLDQPDSYGKFWRIGYALAESVWNDNNPIVIDIPTKYGKVASSYIFHDTLVTYPEDRVSQLSAKNLSPGDEFVFEFAQMRFTIAILSSPAKHLFLSNIYDLAVVELSPIFKRLVANSNTEY